MTAIFGQFGDAPSSFLVAAAARDVVAIRSSMALEPVGAASDHATADLISTTGIGAVRNCPICAGFDPRAP
jgi:hypothetical protein